MKYCLLLFLFLTACGSQFYCEEKVNINIPPVRQPASPCTEETIFGKVHPTLSFQVKQFSEDAIKHNSPCYYTIVIGMAETFPSDIPEQVIGYCQSPVKLMIKKSFWEKASATERLTLMYHELGHCALGLDHKDDVPDIMNSYILDDATAEKQWDKLVTTMFGRAKQ